ncbi:uncharacterized protein BO80DRAFT_486738 [Aspergillus ibericus CBS 121593]|uniref:Uncharacterized protein n=1 Tax=Aspergillus ibericus CBS 121593 TaxID=1448316 RepID=A0A395GJH9_9EURO|nr:hypothetical protein BO80DRAFT_486738 [Aspergillus ibericus CBS 121593]RAK95645.1 hypothetical protein BO80DRAFT_486738 [Aspergillus ibericus CBS 121593]
MSFYNPHRIPPNPQPETLTQAAITSKLDWLTHQPQSILSPTICTQHKITILPLDLEASHHETTNSTTTPLFFNPLSTDLLDTHPINHSRYAWMDTVSPGFYSIRDYSTLKPDAHELHPLNRTAELSRKFEKYMDVVPRVTLPTGDERSLAHLANWDLSWSTDTIYAGTFIHFTHPQTYLYSISRIYRYQDRRYPHLTMISRHWCMEDCPEDHLMRYELVAILQSMNARVTKNGFDPDDTVPALLVSFMKPSHGRILQAHMHEDMLVVAKSPVYSFESMWVAPFELFSRWMLGTPVGLDMGDGVRGRGKG